MIKRAVVYLRVSTGKQVEGASLGTQELMCQSWATNNEVVVDRIFHDDGRSAKNLDRPAIQELLKYIESNKGKVSYLVTYQTDRLARNVSDFFALKIQLSKLGVEYKNINSTSGDNTANDELIQGIEAVLAQHDNRMKSDRVTANMKKHAKDGYRMSKAPHGLKNVRDVMGRSTVVPIEDISDKIRDILLAYSSGAHTIASLLEYARKSGLRSATGKVMSHQSLSKMLRQPLYAGLDKSSHTDGVLMASNFKGIIDESVFFKNQDILKNNKNTNATYKMHNPLFPLRNFLMCSECDTPIRGSSPTGSSGKKYPKYHCTKCKASAVNSDELHEQFLHLLASLKPVPEVRDLIKEVIVRVWREEVKLLSNKEKRLHRKLEKLQSDKKAAINSLIAGDLSKEEKDIAVTGINSEMDLARKQLNEVGEVTNLKDETVDYTLNFISNAPRVWSDADISSQIVYQRLIFPSGISYNLKTNEFGTIKIGPIYTLAGIKKDAEASLDTNLVNYVKSNWNYIFEDIRQWSDLLKGMTVVKGLPAGSRT